MQNDDYSIYDAARPYFVLVRSALGDRVDGGHFFDVVADDIDTAEELYFNDPATAAAMPSGPDWSALPAPNNARRAASSALGLLDFDGGR